MEEWNRDIQGKTSFERVFATISEWVSPGAGSAVFPLHSIRDLESEDTAILDFMNA
ncbi:hypothetical protein HOF92_01965 [bacterium]|nr:hypothetical protein [bacterium]